MENKKNFHQADDCFLMQYNRRYTDNPHTYDGPPKLVWIPAIILTGLLVLLMITAFFLEKTLTGDQRTFMHLAFCALTGATTIFMGGSILMKMHLPFFGSKGKIFISAMLGIALFFLVYHQSPFWFISGLKNIFFN